MIYHVVTKEQWQRSLELGYYEPESVALEGFIHASNEAQVPGVLNRYYKGQTGLLLLHIDEARLTAALKYEMATSVNEIFPHIFGRLNPDAVDKTTEI